MDFYTTVHLFANKKRETTEQKNQNFDFFSDIFGTDKNSINYIETNMTLAQNLGYFCPFNLFSISYKKHSCNNRIIVTAFWAYNSGYLFN